MRRISRKSSFAALLALQLALGLAIAQMKLMGSHGTCDRCGGDLRECSGCNGGRNSGQCSDPACIDGMRCSGGCTSRSRGGGGWL